MDNSDTRKEGVSRTYKGRDGVMRRCPPILGQEGYCLEFELRKGKQHCQKDTPALLARVLNTAREHGRVTVAEIAATYLSPRTTCPHLGTSFRGVGLVSLSETRFRGCGVADESARCSPARSGGYNDFGTSVLRYFGTSVLRYFGHCRAADSSSGPPGSLKLRLPKLSFLERQLLTFNPLQRKRPKRRPLSFRSLNLTPLTLRPLALAASCAGLSATAVAQPMVVAAERGDLALVPYYTVGGEWVAGIHIVNTSEHTQVVKFRFRRATDGMDALDFNIHRRQPHDCTQSFQHAASRGCFGRERNYQLQPIALYKDGRA